MGGGLGVPKTLIFARAPLPPCAEPPVYAVRVARSPPLSFWLPGAPTPPKRFTELCRAGWDDLRTMRAGLDLSTMLQRGRRLEPEALK